jgi:hypothetical protein
MRQPHTEDGAYNLAGDVGRHRLPPQAVGRRGRQCHDRVHMRARLWPEGKDQRRECAAGGDRIGQQGKADISTAELFGHDARTDHADKQKGRRHEFREGLMHNRTAERVPVSGKFEERHAAGSPLVTIFR